MGNESESAVEVGRVLVVDDYPVNRMTLAKLVERLGHTVAIAENGRQALEILASGSFDVVLLDILMPEMDGYEVLNRLKSDKESRDIPVIVISAVDEIDSVVKCIEIGAEDYLPKPFNPTLLKARLHTTLQKKKLRDLEKAYLRQEIMLRQSEKLATLGRLSAGLAHELNNPAAAAQRSAEQLKTAVALLQRSNRALDELNAGETQWQVLATMDELARSQAGTVVDVDPLARSDRESELEDWLGGQGVDDAWECAPVLASINCDRQKLEELFDSFDDRRPAIGNWFCATCTVYRLLRDIGLATERVVELVGALKTYSYMDQAPVQDVDIHQGLENTLIMLRAKLGRGVVVRKEYAAGLPRIPAHGSELNQVWTNLIDNAIDAMDGNGQLLLSTRLDGEWVVVEVEDDGPGIPADIQPRVFDPFFTTKPPGQGTGLGLNIAHNIVVQKHQGKIDLQSQPGRTRFGVWLPLRPRLAA